MTNQITRRTLMTAAPAMALCGAAPAAQPDPFLVPYRQWVEARAEWRRWSDMPGNGNWDLPESKAAAASENEAFVQILETLPTTTEGFAGLAHVVWTYHGCMSHPNSPDYREEMNNPQYRILLNLYRALSGGSEVPLI